MEDLELSSGGALYFPTTFWALNNIREKILSLKDIEELVNNSLEETSRLSA